MKRSQILLSSLLVSLPILSGTAISAPYDDIVAAVDEVEKVMEHCSSVEARVNDIEVGYLSEEKVYFYDDGKPARIVATAYGQHGPLFREFSYNRKGEIIFVYEQRHYHPAIENALVQVTEERAYFQDGQCIRRRTRQYNADPDAKVDVSGIELQEGALDDDSHVVSYESWERFANETLTRLRPLL